MIWTTSLPVSQRIKEIVGEQETYFQWYQIGRGDPVIRTRLRTPDIAPAYTLIELAPVLKKIGEKLDWNHIEIGEIGNYIEPWLYHFSQVANMVALGQEDEAQSYLLSILV